MEQQASPQRVELRRKALEDYRRVVPDDEIAMIRDLAHDLRGLRILELSSTATGGGVAEMLMSLVPLERDLGLDARWHLIAGDSTFFATTTPLAFFHGPLPNTNMHRCNPSGYNGMNSPSLGTLTAFE